MKQRVRTFTVAGLACSFVSVAVLHVVRTDLEPWAHRLSEYANGRHGWLMVLAFVALAGALVALGLAAAGEKGQGLERFAPAALVLAGVGAVVSGVFETSESGTVETVHSRASAFMTVAVVAVALAGAAPLRRPGGRTDVLRDGLAWSAAALTALSVVLHDTAWTGLGQRLLWLVLLAWLLRTALHDRARDRGPGSPVGAAPAQE